MDVKPAWVPEWVWGEYQKLRDSQESWRWALQCATDLRCKCVWDALDARRDGTPFVPASKIDRVLYPESIGEATILLETTAKFSGGLYKWDAISASDRRSVGKKIGASALALRTAMASLPHEDGKVIGTPFEMLFYFLGDDLANELAKDIEKEGRTLTDHDRHTVEIGARYAMEKLEFALTELAKTAKVWTQSKPPVAQVSQPNAGRLYFVRAMTHYFKGQYGQPLREQVAALTSVMFDCDIDGSTVSKLAP